MNKHVNSCEWDLLPFHPTLSDLWNCACSRLFLLGKSFSNGKKTPGETPGRYRNTRECFRWLDEAKTGYVTRWGLRGHGSCAIYFWRRYGGTRSTCQHGSLIPNKHQDSWETVKETNGDEGLGIMKEGWFSHVWIPSSKWWMIVWHFGIYNVSMFQKIFAFQYVHTCKSCKYQWPQLKKSPSGAVNCIPSCWVFST